MPTASIRVAAADPGARFVTLGIGKSVVVDLSRDVRDVLVSNPKIANAVIRSSRRAYLIGGEVGQTNIYFFDGEGRQIAGFDIAVPRDSTACARRSGRYCPVRTCASRASATASCSPAASPARSDRSGPTDSRCGLSAIRPRSSTAS
jgi:Flp pilus assembly secretin CpaC